MVVDLVGELSAAQTERIDDGLPIAVVDATVHCGDLHAVDAGGFGAVTSWAHRVRAQGGTVRLGATSPAVEELARARGLATAADLFSPNSATSDAA